MAEDLEVDEWDLYEALEKMQVGDIETERRSAVTMPKAVERWTDVVTQFSLYNDYPAQMAFFVTLGQILKDKLRVPVGRLSLDPRIHYCWIQTARSGKTTMFDFLSPVWDKTFTLVNEHPLKGEKGPLNGVNEFTLQNPDAFTDQALLGTIKTGQPNPQYATNGTREEREAANVDVDGNPIPELIDININGALFGSGIIAFDEFEHSGIFKETQHKQDTVMMFQKFMNRLDSDTHLIKKRLTEWGKDLVVDCQRSLWATTLPPQGLEKVILTKGVFQRMWLYVREVPESLKMQMEEEYLDMVGNIVEDENGSDAFTVEFSEMLYDIYCWADARYKETGDKRTITTFTPDAQKRLKTVWRGMRKYMEGFPDHIYAALNTFLMNTINNMCNAAALCACAEKSDKITARHIDQARVLTDQSFDSITTWFSDKLKKSPKRMAEKGREQMIAKVYQTASKKDGWVSKTELVNNYMKMTKKSRPTFYREWNNVEHLFENKKMNNRVYIRRKE
jgi:hypothetical protein